MPSEAHGKLLQLKLAASGVRLRGDGLKWLPRGQIRRLWCWRYSSSLTFRYWSPGSSVTACIPISLRPHSDSDRTEYRLPPTQSLRRSPRASGAFSFEDIRLRLTKSLTRETNTGSSFKLQYRITSGVTRLVNLVTKSHSATALINRGFRSLTLFKLQYRRIPSSNSSVVATVAPSIVY